ncbi:MAG: secondary thiamine-phosphate synthase enzyme YjbQ [Candidatus Binataceae bacterium]
MVEFEVTTEKQAQLVDVTSQVNDAVRRSGVQNGMCNVFVPHTTAAVIICENADPDVVHDVLLQLTKLVPRQGGYRHGEGNAQAHILSVILGSSLNVPVTGGQLRLGRWQGVMFAEFDGPRRRKVVVSVTSS